MFIFRCKSFGSLMRLRYYSVQTSTKNKNKNAKSLQHTVFLPKTQFPSYLKPDELVKRDQKIQQEAGFLELYAWQRENVRGKEFVLHDGPPYANGKPHLGHAINKILKDIILRSQLVQGNRVHYVPGWDCHGLPIELIALKGEKERLSPIEIRQKARNVATSMSKIQKNAFKHWGIIGDWEKNCYYTFDKNYVVNQLQIFYKLVEKGLIFYDLKPVFWSPSSQTALAEAELIYKDHVSPALTVRLETIQNITPEPLYLLIWTTTPWTLPLNKAVFYSDTLQYSIVKISSLQGSYIVATKLIKSLAEKIGKDIKEQSVITQEDLKNIKYKHPWNKNEILNIFEASVIKLSGTGLLHAVPAHGHEDFQLGLEHRLKVDCCVDGKGFYTSEAGSDLAGLDILSDGSKYVIERLSEDIILKEDYTHSYPYDWRTEKPVIIRATKQWFIDSDRLKQKAIASLENVKVPISYFQSNIENRRYWCLSRQRTWGVPIPTFYHKTSGRPLISKNLIDHICSLIDTSGPDVWWTEKIENLFPPKICQELFVQLGDVSKGNDIMDIWFDSGVSWSYVLDGKKSDLYLEGVDQYRGWFQSSLLTSVAVKNEAPFGKIVTHGFAVDKDGKKMSKSLGNVVDPEIVISGKDALGVDTLRWWVGSHSHHTLVPAYESILKLEFENVQKIRKTLRFLVGALNDLNPGENFDGCSEKLETIDRYLLNSCYNFYNSVISAYNSLNFQSVTSQVLYFVANDISARYVTVIKDRLYCDRDSERRRACQYTVNAILETLCHAVAPILPHLAEEVYLHHPIHSGRRKLFYNKQKWSPAEFWRDDSSKEKMELVDEIKKEIFNEKNWGKMICSIEIDKRGYDLLKEMQEGKEESIDSELTAIFQVAEVKLKICEGSMKVTLSPTNLFHCQRCRRYTARENDQLCGRCETVVAALSHPLSQGRAI